MQTRQQLARAVYPVLKGGSDAYLLQVYLRCDVGAIAPAGQNIPEQTTIRIV